MSRLYPRVYCTEDGYCKKYSDEEVTSWCVQSPCKDEKPSNADRIRAMTDEELAAWIASIDHDNPCPPDNSCSCSASNCTAGWLDWLQREAET